MEQISLATNEAKALIEQRKADPRQYVIEVTYCAGEAVSFYWNKQIICLLGGAIASLWICACISLHASVSSIGTPTPDLGKFLQQET